MLRELPIRGGLAWMQASSQPRRPATGAAALVAALLASLILYAATPAPARAQAATAHPAPQLTQEVRKLVEDGHYRQALTKASELLRVVKAARGEASAQYAEALSWVGVIYQSMGRTYDAEPFLQQALEIYERTLPAGHPDIATAVNNLGFFHQSAGRYEEAEQHYKRALQMRESAVPPDALAIAESLNNVAQIYKRQGRVEEAEEPLRRSYNMRESILGTDHPAVAQSLQNLAAQLELNLRFEEAEALLRKMLDVRRRVQRENHPDTAAATSKLAQNLYKQRRFVEAEQLFREAIRMQHAQALAPVEAGGARAPGGGIERAGQSQSASRTDVAANTLLDLALNQTELGKLDEAASLLDRVYQLYRRALTPTHPAIAQTLMARAEVDSRQGRHADALGRIRSAVEIRIARATGDDMSQLTYLKHVRFAWRLRETPEGAKLDRKLLDEALQSAQRAARIDSAAALSRLATRISLTDKGLGALVREHNDLELLQITLEEKLDRILAVPQDQRIDVLTDMRQTLASVANRLTDIRERDLKTRYPVYQDLVQPEPLGAEQVRELLGPDEAVVKFLCSYDEMYVWALAKDATGWSRLDLDPEALAQKVQRLREGLDLETGAAASPGRAIPSFDLGLAHELYRRLLAPVASVLARKQHVAFSLCGPLTSLPMHVLVTDPPAVPRPGPGQFAAYRDAKWLARRHATSVLPSLGTLKTLRSAPAKGPARGAMLGLANPATAKPLASDRPKLFTRTSAQGGYATFWRGRAVDAGALRRALPPLPDTETEVRLVASRLGGRADLRFGENARESVVKQARLDDYQVVYFATHGLVAGEVTGQGEPALALTVPEQPNEAEDGLLTASEIGQLQFRSRWVVLTACNTASGGKPRAEALSSLARAFIHAGARTILVSHWRTNAQAAGRVSSAAIYLSSTDGRTTPVESLRRAMQSFSNVAKEPWNAHPALWASFVLVGEGVQ